MKLPKQLSERVKEIYHDEDGWWVVFREPWEFDGFTIWREDAQTKLINAIKDAKKP